MWLPLSATNDREVLGLILAIYNFFHENLLGFSPLRKNNKKGRKNLSLIGAAWGLK